MGVTPPAGGADRGDRFKGDDGLDSGFGSDNPVELLLAAYAIDAVDPSEALAVEALLASSARAATEEATYRNAAGAYASTMLELEPDADVPAHLLDSILARARQQRPAAAAVEPSEAPAVHRIEAQRLLMTLDRIRSDDWGRSLAVPELNGWTVHDLLAHVAASEGLFAQLLGITDPAVPETETGNEERAASAVARHRTLTPAESVAEYSALAEAVDAKVRSLSHAELEREIEWWGVPMQISTVLIHRGFETWIHNDDIRRAAGLADSPPPAGSLRTMSERAIGWLPFMLASAAANVEGATALIVLTGDGGGTHLASLGLEPLTSRPDPVFELSIDVVDFCKAVGNRIPPTELDLAVGGDAELARTLVGTLPSLAGL